MEKKIIQSRYFFLFMLGAATILALFIVNRTTAEDYTLPPRNENTQINQAAVPVGSRLQLKTRFGESWPWDTMQWQDVWTVVQWQDDKGEWFDVTGWQGNLDSISQEEAGWVAVKEWWAADEVLGTGPYRWQAYSHPGGNLLAVSDLFYLADTSGGLVTVDIELTP
ncbi:MAG: hypothetical protein HF973_09515 [Chloroflexi bacterium]|nr:hypothetical protein [Chloroflexota bacterium]